MDLQQNEFEYYLSQVERVTSNFDRYTTEFELIQTYEVNYSKREGFALETTAIECEYLNTGVILRVSRFHQPIFYAKTNEEWGFNGWNFPSKVPIIKAGDIDQNQDGLQKEVEMLELYLTQKKIEA